jgi:hypothetical protein
MTPEEFAKTYAAEWINHNVRLRILDGRPNKSLWAAIEQGFADAIKGYVGTAFEEKRTKRTKG